MLLAGTIAAAGIAFVMYLAAEFSRPVASELVLPTSPVTAQTAFVGPVRGALVIGGGLEGKAVVGRFIELAGGPDASIIIIPTAAEADSLFERSVEYTVLRHFGARNLSVLHTRSRDTANTGEFVAPLLRATGVWIGGGRQSRLVDTYLHTRTVTELHALLGRGGVIGGTSAGASIQSSYMVRGARSSRIMTPGYEEGFGFLRNAAVDQHLLVRDRQDEMLRVIEHYPALLGIGIDEGAAIVVSGDRAEVVGRSKVAFYNAADRGADLYYFLQSGDVFDLRDRRTISGTRLSPPKVLGPYARFRHWLLRLRKR